MLLGQRHEIAAIAKLRLNLARLLQHLIDVFLFSVDRHLKQNMAHAPLLRRHEPSLLFLVGLTQGRLRGVKFASQIGERKFQVFDPHLLRGLEFRWMRVVVLLDGAVCDTLAASKAIWADHDVIKLTLFAPQANQTFFVGGQQKCALRQTRLNLTGDL